VFKNRVLRKIYECVHQSEEVTNVYLHGNRKRLHPLAILLCSKGEEVTWDWRKLRNKELHDLYSPGIVQIIISMRMRWAGNVACVGGKRNAFRFMVQNPVGKNLLGKLKCS
jgi:hypothetical protein